MQNLRDLYSTYRSLKHEFSRKLLALANNLMVFKRLKKGIWMHHMSHVIPRKKTNELFLSKKHAPAQISFEELSVHVYSLEFCAQAVVSLCC